MSASPDRDILNVEEAAALPGVSVKTFNKVLHPENLPAGKIGREQFSRRHLIEWVGSGQSIDYREAGDSRDGGSQSCRTAGWRIQPTDPAQQEPRTKSGYPLSRASRAASNSPRSSR